MSDFETDVETGTVDFDSHLDNDQLIASKFIECFHEFLSSETETIKLTFKDS